MSNEFPQPDLAENKRFVLLEWMPNPKVVQFIYALDKATALRVLSYIALDNTKQYELLESVALSTPSTIDTVSPVVGRVEHKLGRQTLSLPLKGA